MLNVAIRSLHYRHALLLTGTPMYNNWEDLAGQTMLPPGVGQLLVYNTSANYSENPRMEVV